MIIDLFALLCGLAVAAYTATANNHNAWFWWLAGFTLGMISVNPSLLALPWSSLLGFDAPQFAMLILLVSCWVVNNYRKSTIPLFMAGFLTVIWISVLNLQGLPIVAGAIFCIGLALFCIWVSLHKAEFSNRVLEDEANMIVLCFALVLVIVPATISGWESAVTLKNQELSLSAYRENLPVVLSISLLFIILGGFYANWKHR